MITILPCLLLTLLIFGMLVCISVAALAYNLMFEKFGIMGIIYALVLGILISLSLTFVPIFFTQG